jgi:hypothetical protein
MLTTDRDNKLIRSVLDELNGTVGYYDDVERFHRLVACNERLACEIAVAFIRLSEDLKQSHRNLRVEPSPEPTAEPKRDPRVDSIEAQVAANKSRIEELEKQFATLEGSVESFIKRVSKASSESHPVKVGDVRDGKAVMDVLWQLQGDSMVPVYRLYGEPEFRSIGPLEA